MPDWTRVRGGTASPVDTALDEPRGDITDSGGDGIGVGEAVGGAAVGAGALYGLSKLKSAPGILGKLGKLANVGNAVRQQLMLSGFAPVKSVLGNVGTGVEAAVEGRGLRPLKELLSLKTLKDAARSMRSGAAQIDNPVGSAETVNLPAWASLPGRFMSGADDATRAALGRAGYNEAEAANAVLQTPLPSNFGKFGEALESPAARYLHPFRRTPFNQFVEGLHRLPFAGKGTTGAKVAYGVTGAAHGAATEDEQYPVTIPLAIAASGRYGLPYGLAALLGRSLAGGKGGGGVAGSVLPVSEYGYEQALTDPFGPFTEPAAIRAFERLGR